MNIKKYFIFLFFITSIFLFSQKKRNELEKEKLENQLKIAETNKILDETRTKKTATMGQLSVVTEQIKEKNEVIRTFIKEISILNKDITYTENNINELYLKLNSLKEEYKSMIYQASKTFNAKNKLLFLFSAADFNQLLMRLQYFTFYSQARKKQASQINKVTFNLKLEQKRLNEIKIQKQSVLNEIRGEHQNLKSLKNEQESTVKLLSSQEEKLQDELKDREKAVKKLDKLITDLIKREIEKARSASVDKKNLRTPEQTKLSNSFAGNKGKMLWPTEHGFISEPYGTHPHQVLPRVTVINHGVNIQTNRNEKARNVYEGVVSAVAEVPGMNYAIMIQHGDYYTFYAKLKTTSVKVGQKVKAKEFIGEVFTNEDEVTEIQFQIWKAFDKQDPEQWLYPR